MHSSKPESAKQLPGNPNYILIAWFEMSREIFKVCVKDKWLILGMGEKLVQGMFVILQAGHSHQEAFDHLPCLSPVIRLRVGTLQTVQRCLYGLENSEREHTVKCLPFPSLHVLFCSSPWTVLLISQTSSALPYQTANLQWWRWGVK